MDEERKAVAWLHQHGGERRGQNNAGDYVSRRFTGSDGPHTVKPCLTAPLFLNALKPCSERFLTVKDKVFLVGRKAVIINPAQASHTGYLRDQIVIELLHVCQIPDKGLAGFAVDHDPVLRETNDRAAIRNHAAVLDDRLPAPPKSIGQHDFVDFGIYVDKPLYRHDGVITGHDFEAKFVRPVDPGV